MNTKAVLGELYLEKNDYANAAKYLKLACESYGNETTTSFTLNDHIISGETAYDSDVTTKGARTITIDTPLVVQSNMVNNVVTSISDLHIGNKDSGYKECNPIKQVLDWNVTCSLVGEDSSSGTTQYSASNPDNMDGMVIIIVLLMIVSGIYMMMPVIYLQFIVGIARTRISAPLNSIDKFWTFVCFLALIALLIVGVATKKNTYYFVFVCIFLLFFSSKKWISDNVGNIMAKDAASAGPQMVTTLDGKDLDPGMFSILSDSNAFKGLQIVLFFGILATFSTAITLGVSKSEHASDQFTTCFGWMFACAILLTGLSGKYEYTSLTKSWQFLVAVALFVVIGVIPTVVVIK
jgi:hypothetical protein